MAKPNSDEFFKHYDKMINDGFNELNIVEVIQDEFLDFANLKEFSCQDTAILYKLFLNAVFEEYKFPYQSNMKIGHDSDDTEYYIVYCDDLTNEIQTALKIIW